MLWKFDCWVKNNSVGSMSPTRVQGEKMKKVFAVLLLNILLLCAVPALADQIIGTNDGSGGNYYPFGGYNGRYQQVYTASAFSGPITITGLEFFDSFTAGASLPSGTWTIDLAATSADWDTLSSTYATNIRH
jgi:hypothetical protein